MDDVILSHRTGTAAVGDRISQTLTGYRGAASLFGKVLVEYEVQDQPTEDDDDEEDFMEIESD